MKLESVDSKPLDYIKDESSELKGLYDNSPVTSNAQEFERADDFIDNVEDYLDAGNIDKDESIEILKKKKEELEELHTQELTSDEAVRSAEELNEEFRDLAENSMSSLKDIFGEEQSPMHR